MKFIISSNVLLKSLQSVSGVISANSALPIIENFLFEVNGNELTVTGTDNETRASVMIPLDKSDGDGSVAIPPRLLLETLKTMPDVPLTFHVNEDNYGVELRAGEGRFKMAGQSAENYPQVAVLDNANNMIIHSVLLQNVLSKTIFAAGTDELRPQLTGVYFELDTDHVNFVATDAHKLVRFRRNDLVSDAAHSFIVHRKPLNLLKNLLASFDTDVTINFNDTNVAFGFANFMVTCRLLEGKFPSYEGVIPKDNPNKMVISRPALINTLKRVSNFASQSTHQVRFKITGQELVVSAEDTDFSNEARERLTCNYSGTDIEIGFNSKFLQEMINNLECDEVTFELSIPSKAALIIPEQTNSAEEDVLMLVMPVMLNS